MQIDAERLNEVIEGCKNDDRNAQERLYRSYYRAMMNLCLRYTKNESDAMEALNSGFYKVFKNIGRYEPQKAALYTWISVIIIHSCIDLIKRNEKVRNGYNITKAPEIVINPDVISKMGEADLLRIIRELPPVMQTVFNLFIIEGYSHKEIGGLLGISEGTSKWHLSEARKKLQTLIQTL